MFSFLYRIDPALVILTLLLAPFLLGAVITHIVHVKARSKYWLKMADQKTRWFITEQTKCIKELTKSLEQEREGRHIAEANLDAAIAEGQKFLKIAASKSINRGG